MWKTIQPGESVFVGDTIRHQSIGQHQAPREEVYEVVKQEQHYFEIVQQTGIAPTPEDPRRKVIRYIDIGYHVHLEKWTGP
jgi:uncharacterized protein YerC